MISIVIVGYNNQKDLPGCLKSIYKSSYKDFNVVFVDNKSEDNSVDYVKKTYPQAIVIENGNNDGFSKGNNIGIKKAIELGSKYIFILNPDTEIDKDCLQLLIKESDQKCILQPLVLLHKNGKGTDFVNTSGGTLHFLGFSYCCDYKVNKEKIKNMIIPVASGAAFFATTQMFLEVGSFDENFFMYHEDVDLSWRARLKGYDVKLISNALIWHKYSFSRNKKKMFFTERNRWLFIFKNYSLKTILLLLPILIINDLFVCLLALKDGWLIYKIQSIVSVFMLHHKTLLNRRNIQKNRAVSDKDLKKFFSTNLNFSEVGIPALSIYNKFATIVWNVVSKLI